MMQKKKKIVSLLINLVQKKVCLQRARIFYLTGGLMNPCLIILCCLEWQFNELFSSNTLSSNEISNNNLFPSLFSCAKFFYFLRQKLLF